MIGNAIAIALTTISLSVSFQQFESQRIEAPEMVKEYCEVAEGWTGVDRHILEAICFMESSFREKAINGDCVGYMGVSVRYHQAEAEAMGLNDLLDGYTNIIVASSYLGELLEKYPTELALMVYHGEANALEKYERGEFSFYAKRVLELAKFFEGRYGRNEW